jgi:hypothetical protein
MAAAQIIHGRFSPGLRFEFLAPIFGANVPSLRAKRKSLCHAPAAIFLASSNLSTPKYAACAGLRAYLTNSQKIPITAT